MMIGSRAALVGLACAASACAAQPTRHTIARVVSIDPSVFPYMSDKVLVRLETPEGLTGFASVSVKTLHCHVGDEVPVVVKGVSLQIVRTICGL